MKGYFSMAVVQRLHLTAICWLLIAVSGCRAPVREQSWTLSAPEGFGTVLAIVRCGDIAYLADTRQKIRRYDLGASKALTDLPIEPALAVSMAVDCANHSLFVVSLPMMRSGATVRAFDLESGKTRREYPLPMNFLPRYGARLIGADTLVLSGLWVPAEARAANLIPPAETYYETARLGIRLSLTDGAARPLVVPYEIACFAGGQCPDVRLDAAVTATGIRYVAALPASDHVGVYSSENSTATLIDTRSPRFVRSGARLPTSAAIEDRMRWLGENSTIERIVAFAKSVAVIHAKYEIPPDWRMGQPTGGNAFLNVYDWNGRLRRADQPVPRGFGAGFDEHSLYVADYGVEGPRDGVSSIQLRQIPID